MRPAEDHEHDDGHRRGNQLWAFVGLSVCVGLVVIAYLASKQVILDKTTLCPKDDLITARYAVLIDATDAFNPIQTRYLDRYFSTLKSQMPTGAEITLHQVLPDSNRSLEPIYRRCKPRSGRDANSIYENPRRIEKQWSQAFVEPLDRLFDQLLSRDPAPYSPILESIQAVALTAYPPLSDRNRDVPRSLTIVSDMLQHTRNYSHYAKGGPSFDDLRSTSAYQRLRTDLSGVAVTILYVRRDKAQDTQGRSHIRFWENAMTDMGARIERVLSVDG
jgi:hypothetical protein